MLANFERIIETEHAPILIGGLVTMISNAIGLRQPVLGLNPYGGIRPMNTAFCFNTNLVGNLGPHEFELLINHEIVHQFVLPHPITSLHNIDNWLFDLNLPPTPPTPPETPQRYEILDEPIPDAEYDPETPPLYHHFPSLERPERPVPSCESAAPVNAIPRPIDHATTILDLQNQILGMRGKLTTLRVDFQGFMDLMTERLDDIYQHLYSHRRGKSFRRFCFCSNSHISNSEDTVYVIVGVDFYAL